MTQFLNKTFTLPVNTKTMSKELFAYRCGLITAKEYEKLMGHKPDEEEKNAVISS